MKRRTFLTRSSSLLAAPILLNGMRLSAWAAPTEWLASLAGASDRVLVIIQMEGGNDGLNMVIPAEDDQYYKLRPTLGIAKSVALPLAGQPLLRLHPKMGGVRSLFDDGRLAIVENIGYDGMNLSHFTGTEIWNTASGNRQDQFLQTGWIGRYLQHEYPDFPAVLPADPPAIEISLATSTVFTVQGASIGMSLTDPQQFYGLVNGGAIVRDDLAPDNRSGREWNFVDSINNQSQVYSEVVRAAAQKGSNRVSYPDDNLLAQSLGIIARLVAGGLGTRIYKVTLGGFDTHSTQAPQHEKLLTTLSDAIKLFQDDLIALGVDQRVVGMTYSEFGRRAGENGSGTDHGTSAPHFVFGSSIDGGRVFGGIPNLGALDANGNLPAAVDFRCYYSSIFAPLFNLDAKAMATVLPIHPCDLPDYLPLFRIPQSGADSPAAAATGVSVTVQPNPVSGDARITLRSPRRGTATIMLTSAGGERVRRLYSGEMEMGSMMLRCDLSGVPAGSYIVTAEIAGGMATTKVTVVR
ncbi:MAG: DUF1501 domain-containing protein [Candidatus Kapaibacterium sp.]